MTLPSQHARRNTTTTHIPTVAVVGVGAIGTVIADALTHRAQVTLCRRGSTSPMILSDGSASHQVAADVATSPTTLHPVDWVVIATKAQDTESVGMWLEKLVGPQTKVLVAQNGIDHASRVERWVPKDRVVPAVVYINAEREGRDRVRVRRLNHLVLPDTKVSKEFAELAAGYLPVHRELDFEKGSWRKLIMNAAASSVTALTGQTAEVLRRPDVAGLVDAVLREGLTVATAAGVGLDPSEFVGMRATIGELPPSSATSMQLDRSAGRPLESDFLTGALLREGRRSGVSLPVVATLHALLSGTPPRV